MSSETKCGKQKKINMDEIMKAVRDQVMFGTGAIFVKDGEAKHVDINGTEKGMNLDDLMSIKKRFDENEKGVKHDGGKRQWALIPWRELGQVADVLTFGTKKYSPDNWMHVPGSERRYFEAAMRHITSRQSGEINDPEMKLPHLAHAICCLLFWAWHDNQNRRGHR